MQNHNFLYRVASAILSCLLISCATTNAPKRWLSEPEEVSLDAYGSWIDVRSQQNRISGELIAVTKDTLFVTDTVLHAIVSKDILSARLVTYHAGNLGGLVVFGTLSTISNGFYLLLTAPMWLIFGSGAAVYRSYEPIIDYPQKSIEHFKPFARYPQGLPANLDRRSISIKTLRRK
jgi:hypothetical protein